MQTLWIFVLTLGMGDNLVMDMDFAAATEAKCWESRTYVMEQVQETSDKYRYWYITACEKRSRSTSDELI